MGRIKTAQVKRAVKKLLTQQKGKFTADFEKNKQIMTKIVHIPSKKLRNVVAGYITRQVKLQG
ncbi:30S ribosomal protein S17e [Candidatus Woesearchaeota archaeon]|nr:30S ribosomal protein S17e [Candidatus Woesearchaeota archaeon]